MSTPREGWQRLLAELAQRTELAEAILQNLGTPGPKRSVRVIKDSEKKSLGTLEI